MRTSGVLLVGLHLGLAACADEERRAGPGGAAGSGAGAAGTSGAAGSAAGGAGAAGDAGAACEPDPGGVERTFEEKYDPLKGKFSLEAALAGLPEGPGPLRAILTTGRGVLTCELRPDVAPLGVANFVGLARATRPFRNSKKKWVTGRFYDGLLFHRVIPQFVAQGGDPLGTGAGGPGYKLQDEIGSLSHVPGALAYANSGPNTSGSQFYVVAEQAVPELDGDYTIFGLCAPVPVVTALTAVPTGADDRPLDDLLLTSVVITRCAP